MHQGIDGRCTLEVVDVFDAIVAVSWLGFRILWWVVWRRNRWIVFVWVWALLLEAW
jgi:hypothetical protein